jgi:hypothetical protein
MATLTFTQLTWPTAGLGVDSVWPMVADQMARLEFDQASLPDTRLAEGLRRGQVASLLPLTKQSGYDRQLRDVDHPVAVLEGHRLRATFLLGLGGRLWSLVEVASGRELLYRNPAIQFANLAIRDAWFAGGVEWNVGLTGHTPGTCSPVHATGLDTAVGPVLRLWEYDRVRDGVWRLDAWLDDQTGLLCVRPEILNPHPHPVPTYWWSNIAVPQTADTRVMVPAESAWRTDDQTRSLRQVAVGDEADLWYPGRAGSAADFFFDLRQADRPWIAAVEPDGQGLVQTSTAALEGRKLFRWGQGRGGRHWQRWLSPLGGQYAEVQAGLARTQAEHIELGPGARLAWLETYGPIRLAPGLAGDPHWRRVRSQVAQRIHTEQPDSWWRACTAAGDRLAAQPAPAPVHRGSGWGALERERRARGGDGALDLPATPFTADQLGPLQQPWLDLLDGHGLGSEDPDRPTGSHQSGAGWAAPLRRDGGWRARLHLGEVLWHQGDQVGARQEWLASAGQCPNPWAWRNLGASARRLGDRPGAAQAYAQAWQLRPGDPELALEYLGVLEPAAALALVDACPTPVVAHPRVRLAQAEAALASGDIQRTLAALDPLPEVPNLREGEVRFDELWSALQRGLAEAEGSIPAVAAWRARGPELPWEWDFRMR